MRKNDIRRSCKDPQAKIPKIEWDAKTACNKAVKEHYLQLLDAIDVAIEALGY